MMVLVSFFMKKLRQIQKKILQEKLSKYTFTKVLHFSHVNSLVINILDNTI